MSKTYCSKLFKAIDNKNYKCGDYIQNLIVYGIGAQYAQCDDCRRLDSSISHAKQSILAEVAKMIAAATPKNPESQTLDYFEKANARGQAQGGSPWISNGLEHTKSAFEKSCEEDQTKLNVQVDLSKQLDSLRADLQKQHAEVLELVETLVKGGK